MKNLQKIRTRDSLLLGKTRELRDYGIKKETFLGLLYLLVDILDKLAKSKFRSRFKLHTKELEYIKTKGLDKIYSHACDFIRDRIAPAVIPNDGKQTPMRGHPVFIAQHATATCCRGCIEKWHHYLKGIELTQAQQEHLVSVIMEWIKLQIDQ